MAFSTVESAYGLVTPTFNGADFNQSANISSSTDHNNTYEGNTNPRFINGVIVLLLMVLNLLGNGLVFWVYHTLAKQNVFNLFVKVLAALDILTALTTMLMDTMSKMRPKDDGMNMDVLCKISHYQVYATSLTNGCVLTLIAYQRYRKICLPLKPGLTIYQAKLILVIATVSCLLVSVLALVIKGPQTIQVRMNNDKLAEAVICRYDKAYNDTLLQPALTYLLIACFLAVLLSMAVFYVLVYRALRRFERRNSALSPNIRASQSQAEGEASSCIDPPRSSRAGSSMPDEGTVVRTPNIHVNGAGNGAEERRRQFRAQSRAQSIFSLGGGPDSVSGQMYKTFFIITMVFIVSYLPHLVVLILEKALKLNEQVLTYTQRIFIEIAYNCPYISTVANPIVYGFRSGEFRENVKKILKCRCRRRRHRYW